MMGTGEKDLDRVYLGAVRMEWESLSMPGRENHMKQVSVDESQGVRGRVVELFVSTWGNKRTIYLSAIKFRAATAQSF